MLDVLQGGGEGVYELVRQLRQEADGVHVQDGHATGQLARVKGDIQGGEELVSGLKAAVTSQRLDEGRFSCVGRSERRVQSNGSSGRCTARLRLPSPQFVYPNTDTTGNSLCLR